MHSIFLKKEHSGLVISAPIKINFSLFITGKRADGYHLLETCVGFALGGDILRITPADRDSFFVDGPFASGVSHGGDNLVIRARECWRDRMGGNTKAVAIVLTKNLPVASGIGGGSGDCAATLAGMNQLMLQKLSKEELQSCACSLGADVPMCLAAILDPSILIAHSIGEQFDSICEFPRLYLVLLYPGIGLSTAKVFAKYDDLHENLYENLHEKMSVDKRRMKDRQIHAALLNAPIQPSFDSVVPHLVAMHNDLYEAARSLLPLIEDMLTILREHGALLARMSGSGSTCFGLYHSREAAEHAQNSIARHYPDFFVLAVTTLGK